MTPSQQAKREGLKSLSQAARLANKPRKTLENWHKNNPALFDIVLKGCKTVIER